MIDYEKIFSLEKLYFLRDSLIFIIPNFRFVRIVPPVCIDPSSINVKL